MPAQTNPKMKKAPPVRKDWLSSASCNRHASGSAVSLRRCKISAPVRKRADSEARGPFQGPYELCDRVPAEAAGSTGPALLDLLCKIASNIAPDVAP